MSEKFSAGPGNYYVCLRSRANGRITYGCPVPPIDYGKVRRSIDESNQNRPFPHFDRVLAYKERDSDPEFIIIYGPKTLGF